MHEAVMEYRRKLASLTPQNKHIWELAHIMMDEMAHSEEAGMRDQWHICQRHGNASREAENELLDLLATPASTGEADGAEQRLRSVLMRIITDLPLKRDWLDPDLEREARSLIITAPTSVPQAEPPK